MSIEVHSVLCLHSPFPGYPPADTQYAHGKFVMYVMLGQIGGDVLMV